MNENQNSENLFDKATQNFNVAKILYKETEDDVYLNYVGYHIQQSVELSIKHQLELFGLDYPKIHDIEQLILYAKKNNANIIVSDYVSNYSERISSWESKTRYVLNYFLERKKILEALDEVEKHLSVIKEKLAEQNVFGIEEVEKEEIE